MSEKPQAGAPLPVVTLPKVGGGDLTLGGEGRWQFIVVYRGKHCPLCQSYLDGLEAQRPALEELGMEVVAVSADPAEKAEADNAAHDWNFAIGYDLGVPQMRELGLYVSDPRSAEETDRPFAEPALFVVRPDGNTQIIDISNAPFARADLRPLPGNLKWLIENDYPVRGTATD